MEFINKKFKYDTNINVEYIKPYNNYDIYLFKCETISRGKTKITEGICTSIPEEDYPQDTNDYVLVSDEIVENMRQERDHNNRWNNIYNAFDTPYSNYEQGIYDRIIKVDISNYMIFDLNGKVLPQIMHFDYIGANIHNGAYDLKKALEILKTRDDIKPGIHPYLRFKFSDKLEIQMVPGYNRSKNQCEYLDFYWVPSVEDYRKMYDKSLELNHKFSSEYFAVFELDLLGLRAGEAAKYNDFYKTDEYNGDEDENE